MTRREPQVGTTPLPGEWATKGACVGRPTAWWFPGYAWRKGPVAAPVERATAIWAKGICDHCPVSRPCLDHALRYREVGVWGGTDDAERRQMRKRGAA